MHIIYSWHVPLLLIGSYLESTLRIFLHLLGWLKLDWKGWLSAPRPVICLLFFLLLFQFCIWAAHIDPPLLPPASVVQQRFIVWVAAMGAFVSASYGSSIYFCFLLMYVFWLNFFGNDKKKKHYLKIDMPYEFWCTATRIFPNKLLQIGDDCYN